MDEEQYLKPEHVSASARPYIDAGPLTVSEYAGWLKALREEKKLTLAELSELTGYSTSYLSQIETGKKKNMPSPGYLEKVATPLGVYYSDLLNLAGYVDLAKGVKYREAVEIFSDDELKQMAENEKFISGLTDLKVFLERKVSPYPHYNGHRLTDQDRQRILDMLKALFPEYQQPPASTDNYRTD